MEFVQELVIAVELSECLGVAIAVGEDELTVLEDVAKWGVRGLKNFLKSLGLKGYSKLNKDGLVAEVERVVFCLDQRAKAYEEVGKSKAKKAGGARKRKK